MTQSLILPHGGLQEPVNRTVPAEKMTEFIEKAKQLPQVPVSDADLSSVYRFGDGGLSPLEGPMGADVYDRVLEEHVIESNGALYAWTIPIALPVTQELAGKIASGDEVALVNTAGEIVGTLEVTDVFEWDKQKYLNKVYRTDRTDHPGADMVLVGDADKDASSRRNDPRPAATEAPPFRQVRPDAARSPRPVGR